jgi:predicted nucleotidyltransferase component of viral defense system
MISKQEILSIANISKLPPTTVEKDYVLSWVLYGISRHPQLSQWVFKGGTCLKKCYFETYRFSEDLDFTVPAEAIYTQQEILNALGELATIIEEETGINIKSREIEVKESFNKNGSTTFIAKLTYDGPLRLPAYSQQRIKFDVTNDEIIIDGHEVRTVFSQYSDAPQPPVSVKCYTINEILAEKTRAIYERQGRARDIYDVVNIGRNFRNDVDVKKALDGIKGKFKFKLLPEPSVDLILSQIDIAILKANWEQQLKHQLQILPPVETYFSELKTSLSWWIEGIVMETSLTTISGSSKEVSLPKVYFPESVSSPSLNLGIGRTVTSTSFNQGASTHMDKIRFAARNRLQIYITYHGIVRLVEPYSLRRPSTGNLLLYVYETRRGNSVGGGIKAYKVAEILNTETTEELFTPRYVIEL